MVQDSFDDIIEQTQEDVETKAAERPQETDEEAYKRIVYGDESELKKGEYVEMGGVVVKGKKPKSKFWPILKKILKGILKGLWWLIKNILLLVPRMFKLMK